MCLQVCSIYCRIVQVAPSSGSTRVIAYGRHNRCCKAQGLQKLIYHNTEIQWRTAKGALIAYDIKQCFADTDNCISLGQLVLSKRVSAYWDQYPKLSLTSDIS